MQIALKVLIAVMLVLGAFLVFSPKDQKKLILNDRPRSEALHTYYYYPKANFYYDSTEGKYICWDSTALEWKEDDKLPVQQVDLGKTVRIGESAEPVWADNQQHRLIYSVSLYSGPEDFKKEEKTVFAESDKSNTPKSEKAEKKSGVRKFFDRVFPPKKKDS
ncbi:MAG: hypothetical protein H7122_06780 [Chitinophagaceae bacterium]|nr:hypothetical protein [Chitinophagaceae bacterium]